MCRYANEMLYFQEYWRIIKLAYWLIGYCFFLIDNLVLKKCRNGGNLFKKRFGIIKKC